MKIALLTREYPPEVYGGAGVHVEYLARELAQHVEVAVHAMGEPRSDPLVASVSRPWEVLDGSAPHLAALRWLSADLPMVAAVEGADLAHSHTWYANFAGHLAKLVYGIPHVCTAHSLEPLRPWKAEQLGGGYAISSFCERTALESADAVIAVSGQMRTDVLAAYPAIDPDRVHVIHNGIAPDEYQRTADADVLIANGIDPDRPVVAFIGRITRQKGLLHLLDAAELLSPAAQLVLCAGSPDTPLLAAEVRARVDALQASRGGVTWLSEMLSRAEAIQVLSHATVFVCPSIYEPFGLVNVEAMACGAAVVASAIGGIPEIVVDGETGFLVGFEPGDDAFGSPADPAGFARGLADAIDALVADPARAEAMGAAGRRRVVDQFSWSAVAEQTAALYASLLA